MDEALDTIMTIENCENLTVSMIGTLFHVYGNCEKHGVIYQILFENPPLHSTLICGLCKKDGDAKLCPIVDVIEHMPG